MPLVSGKKAKTESGFSENVRREMKAGKKQSQAVAIAYAKKREANDSENVTSRTYDINGWAEIKDNPISKVGVFDYLGSQISPDLQPNQIYKVYRPEEELSNIETINSFRLLPWTDEHAMLGSESGFTPAEKKGVHGVIGEDVYYADGYLRGNLKVFSEKLADLIESGKKELSIGYRCLYDVTSGVYDGQKYDAIQRNIRGNHLALVDEGRSGHDVAVLDHFKLTFDTRDLTMAKPKITLESLAAQIQVCCDSIEEMKKEKAEDVEPDDFVKKSEVTDADPKKDQEETEDDAEAVKEHGKDEYDRKAKDKKAKDKKAKDEDESEKEEQKKDKEAAKAEDAMDAKIKDLTRQVQELKENGARILMREISKRDELAEKLSRHVGTFDHKDKTLDEVAAYGIKKLGLKCRPGHEDSVLSGYLAAAKTNTIAIGQDRKVEVSDSFQAYLNGESK